MGGDRGRRAGPGRAGKQGLLEALGIAGAVDCLGAMRDSQPPSSSAAHSARTLWALRHASQASRSAGGPGATASRRIHSLLSFSSRRSVSVPGVTTRTTLRSTGPLAHADFADLLADRHRLAHL